jgi:hypothetical protein
MLLDRPQIASPPSAARQGLVTSDGCLYGARMGLTSFPAERDTISLSDRTTTTICWVVVAGIFVLLRFNVYQGIYNPDELVPIHVAEGMRLLGRLDPNFINAPNIEPSFKIDEYHLYLYNIISSFVIDLVGGDQQRQIFALRGINILYQGGAIALLTLALRNIGARGNVQIGTAFMLAIAPALVHDAHMARAESMLYLTLATLIWVLSCRASLLLRSGAAGVLLAAGISSKATFGLAALIVQPVIWTGEWRNYLKRDALLACGVAIGLCISAPYALLHYDAALRGFEALRIQYSTYWPPHSLPDYSLIGQIEWVGRFFLSLYGSMIPVALLAPAIVRGGVPPLLIGLWIFCVATVGYFAPQLVFFERSFCLAVFVASPIFVWTMVGLQHRAVVAVLFLLAVAPMAWWSTQIALASAAPTQRLLTWQAAHPFTHGASAYKAGTPCEGLFIVGDYNEPASGALIAKLVSDGFPIVARYESRFSWLPSSTLNTYLDVDLVYFSCRAKTTSAP